MKIFGYPPAEIRKAFAGGVLAAAGPLGVDLSHGALSWPEVGSLVAAFVVGAGTVFHVPNRDPAPSKSPSSSQQQLY